MAKFMNGSIVSIPDDVVADIEDVISVARDYSDTEAGSISSVRRLQTFLTTYKQLEE